MKTPRKSNSLAGAILALSVGAVSANAASFHELVVLGTDAIWLAGRTDLVIPPYSVPPPGGWVLGRHGGGTPEMLAETFPSSVSVAGASVVKVADPGLGEISFFNGFGSGFGPEGNTGGTSLLTALGGISGYHGSQGALVGLFLDDGVPSSGPAPSTLDFSTAALRDFDSLSPALGQIFFIGDGIDSGGDFQAFNVPLGATRLFVGIPDGFGFNGPPGAYDDNDGSYSIRIGIDQNPTPPPAVPEVSTIFGAVTLGALVLFRRKKTSPAA